MLTRYCIWWSRCCRTNSIWPDEQEFFRVVQNSHSCYFRKVLSCRLREKDFHNRYYSFHRHRPGYDFFSGGQLCLYYDSWRPISFFASSLTSCCSSFLPKWLTIGCHWNDELQFLKDSILRLFVRSSPYWYLFFRLACVVWYMNIPYFILCRIFFSFNWTSVPYIFLY